MADRLTGLHAVYAVTAGLYQREKTGEGDAIEVPMFESFSHFVLGDHLAGYTYEPAESSSFYRRALARRPYITTDSYICALVYNDKQWVSFCKIIGRQDLMKTTKFKSQQSRQENIEYIYEFLDGVFKTKTTDEWVELLEKGDIPVSRMNNIGELIADEHLNTTGFFSMEHHPSEGLVRGMRTPTNWALNPPPSDLIPAPTHGQHSEEILKEAGYSGDEISQLVKSGVTRSS